MAVVFADTTMDPLCEKYYDISPYAWCGNNFVNTIDPLGLDTFNLDQKGYIVSRIENTDADVINIVEQNETGEYILKFDDKGKPLSISLQHETIEINKSQYAPQYKALLDWYVIRGDANAKCIFEFLAINTTVEWSLLQMGISGPIGLNVLSTSHIKDAEMATIFLYNNKYKYGYTIRTHNHSHPNNIEFPSGTGGENGDVVFADILERNNERLGYLSPRLYIFIPNKRKYVRYNSKSTINLPGVTCVSNR